MFSILPNWRDYIALARMDKPIGAWLLLLPCWWGMLLVMQYGGALLWHGLFAVYFALGAVLMRSAGCVWNDILDRNADAMVERTANRPIASGRLSVTEALFFLAVLCLASLVILLQLPIFAVVVTLFSLFLVAMYPLMKRVTYWPQAWLGLTFNWGVWVGGFSISPTPPVLALAWLYVAGIFWTLGYDTIYAMQDVKDDKRVGVKSTAILFGRWVPYWVLVFFFVSHSLIAYAVNIINIAPIFWIFWGAGALHLFWQYKSLKGKTPDYNKLFKSNRDYGLLIAVGMSASLF